jgi:hypothetical protein
MRRSTDLIVTTHAGSLPREEDLGVMIRRKAQGEIIDEEAFFARVKKAVGDVVRRQAEAGIDIASDGEQGRVGFIPYVNERLTGITPSPTIEAANYWSRSREYRAFPDFYAWSTSLPWCCRQYRADPLGVHGSGVLHGACRSTARHRRPESGDDRTEVGRSFHAGCVAIEPSQLEPQ